MQLLLQLVIFTATVLAVSTALPIERYANLSILGTIPGGEVHLKTEFVPQPSCEGMTESGQYPLNIGDNKGEFTVYCDMDEYLLKGPGWIVIQRRGPDVDPDYFNRDWKSYKNGFGNFHGSFWLGLEKIHRITKSGNHELYIGMEATLNRQTWAYYGSFQVGDEASNYEITKADGYEGDSLESSFQVGQQFFTADEMPLDPNCPNAMTGGWWFTGCRTPNLNGRYYPSGTRPGLDGINWPARFSTGTAILRVMVAIRPKK